MKKLKLLLLLTVTILTTVAIKASGQTNSEVFINRKGEIHNHGGTKLGFIDKDDIVRNSKGQKLYFIDKNGNVIDANGKKLGKAQINGNYYNMDGVSVITVKDKDAEQCQILDPKGHSLGTVHKNYKLHACAAHCFFLTQKSPTSKK